MTGWKQEKHSFTLNQFCLQTNLSPTNTFSSLFDTNTHLKRNTMCMLFQHSSKCIWEVDMKCIWKVGMSYCTPSKTILNSIVLLIKIQHLWADIKYEITATICLKTVENLKSKNVQIHDLPFPLYIRMNYKSRTYKIYKL